MFLSQIGFDQYYENLNINQLETIGRVTACHRQLFTVITEENELSAILDNKLYKSGKFPAVGDFVRLNHVDEGTIIINEILPQKSKFSRKAAGDEVIEQVIAANFDYVFIISALNKDFNLRKIERYLTAAYDSGATPIIILSKADLCDDVDVKLKQVEVIAPFIDIIPISSHYKIGLERIEAYFKPGKTVVLLGSSGVGKSTLVNTLSGTEVLKVSDVREGDDRGRHTTTHRELIILPNQSMIIDTPGIRELALWNTDSVDNVFTEVTRLTEQCKFSNCSHTNEPGCAIIEALDNHTLDLKRYESYLKLKKEQRYIESKTKQKLRIEEKKRSKSLATFIRHKKSGKEVY